MVIVLQILTKDGFPNEIESQITLLITYIRIYNFAIFIV